MKHYASPFISRYVHKLVAERGKSEAVATLHERAATLKGKNCRRLKSELLTLARELQCQS